MRIQIFYQWQKFNWTRTERKTVLIFACAWRKHSYSNYKKLQLYRIHCHAKLVLYVILSSNTGISCLTTLSLQLQYSFKRSLNNHYSHIPCTLFFELFPFYMFWLCISDSFNYSNAVRLYHFNSLQSLVPGVCVQTGTNCSACITLPGHHIHQYHYYTTLLGLGWACILRYVPLHHHQVLY